MTKRELEVENAFLRGRIVELEKRLTASYNPFDYFKPLQPHYTGPTTGTKIWLNTPTIAPHTGTCDA